MCYNNEVVLKIEIEKAATGLEISEGFGQTETTLTIANLRGTPLKLGSMGKASPQYEFEETDGCFFCESPGFTKEIETDNSSGDVKE